MSIARAALVVDPVKWIPEALKIAAAKVKPGGYLDIMVIGIDDSLASAQSVALALYDAASATVDPEVLDVTVYLRPVLLERDAIFATFEYPGAQLLETNGSPQNILPQASVRSESRGKWGVVAVGGTFDHLHYGHRLLLTLAGWVADHKLIVGITGPQLLKNKQYAEYLESYETRDHAVREFLSRIYPSLPVHTEAINDVYGPTGTVSAIDALVLSHETRSGGEQINQLRESKGWNSLAIVEVGLIGGPEKLSSTDLRRRDKERTVAGSL